MTLQAVVISPPYRKIPAEEAERIHTMELEEPQVLHKKIKIKEEEEFAEGIDVAWGENDEEEAMIAPGTIKRLNLNRLKIGWLLKMTGNFTEKQLKSKYGCIYRTWQVLLSVLLVAYLLFGFGIIKIKGIRPVVEADGQYPFTEVHDAVWELKWLLAFLLGISYFGSGHIERFLQYVSLCDHIYQKGKRHGRIYLLTIGVVVLLIPSSLHGMQLYDLGKNDRKEDLGKEIVVCDLLYTLFRAVTVPSFCVVTMVLYLIKVQIDSLGQSLKCTNRNLGLSYAKREITAVKRMIRTTDSKLKWYLICHMVLILITAFTGIFSCIERMHITLISPGNRTTSHVTLKEIEASRQYPRQLSLDFIGLRTDLTELDSGMPQNKTSNIFGAERIRWLEGRTMKLTKLNRRLLNLTVQMISEAKMRSLTPVKKHFTLSIQSSGGGPSHLMVKFLDKSEPFRVMMETVIAFIEVLLLFLLPLLLLAWHERAIARITEEVEDLDIEDQRRTGFLFDCESSKEQVVKSLTKMRGVSIFGMRVSFYKAAFVAILAPFITVVLHFIFKKYGLI